MMTTLKLSGTNREAGGDSTATLPRELQMSTREVGGVVKHTEVMTSSDHIDGKIAHSVVNRPVIVEDLKHSLQLAEQQRANEEDARLTREKVDPNELGQDRIRNQGVTYRSLLSRAEAAVGCTEENKKLLAEAAVKYQQAGDAVQEAKWRAKQAQDKINAVDERIKYIQETEIPRTEAWAHEASGDEFWRRIDWVHFHEGNIQLLSQQYEPLNEELFQWKTQLAMREDKFDQAGIRLAELNKAQKERRRDAEDLTLEAYGRRAAELLAQEVHSDPLAEGLMLEALKDYIYVDPRHPEYGTRTIGREVSGGEWLSYQDQRVAGITDDGRLVAVISTGGDPASYRDKPDDTAWDKSYLTVQFDPIGAAKIEMEMEAHEDKLRYDIVRRQNRIGQSEIGHAELESSTARLQVLAELKGSIAEYNDRLQVETDPAKIAEISDSIVDAYTAVSIIESIELESELLGIDDDSERSRTIRARIDGQMNTLRLIYDINGKRNLIESVGDLNEKKAILEEHIRDNDRLIMYIDKPEELRYSAKNEGGIEDSRRLIDYQRQEELAPAKLELDRRKSDAIDFKEMHPQDETGFAEREVKIGEQEAVVAAISASIGRLEGRLAGRIETSKYLSSGARRDEIIKDTESCRRVITLIDGIQNSESQVQSSETDTQASNIEEQRALFDVRISDKTAIELTEQIRTNTYALGFMDGVEDFDVSDHINRNITTIRLWADVREKRQLLKQREVSGEDVRSARVDLSISRELLRSSRIIEKNKRLLRRYSGEAYRSAVTPHVEISRSVTSTMQPTEKEAWEKGAIRGLPYDMTVRVRKLGSRGEDEPRESGIRTPVYGREYVTWTVDEHGVRLPKFEKSAGSGNIYPIRYFVEALNRLSQHERQAGLGHVAALAEIQETQLADVNN